MAAILKFSKKSNESLNNKLHHFLYIFGDKKPDEAVILVIRGQILPLKSPKVHVRYFLAKLKKIDSTWSTFLKMVKFLVIGPCLIIYAFS